jgi:F0F1-type ATP synthase membrane subunit b/b'
MTLLAPLLLMLFIGALMFLALRFVLTQHFTKATGHLYALSQETLLQQEGLKKKLMEGDRHYQEQIAKAQEEGNKLRSKILQEADVAKQEVIQQAHKEAERIVQQAIQTRDALQKELNESMDAKAVERGAQLLQGVLPQGLRQAAHSQWVDELILNGLISVEKLQVPDGAKEVKVASAFPLTPAQKKVLSDRLQKALGFEVTLQEKVEASLVAGIVITIGSLVLDGSLASRLREAARNAQNPDD